MLRCLALAAACAGIVCSAGAASSAGAAADRLALAPAPPFPAVLGSSVERETIAPGIAHVTYHLRTVAGPVVASVILINLADPRVHVATVLAHDTTFSSDERVSSMAHRTHAVAGINGDYFDINATGAPLGILVRDGQLLRSPSMRAAFAIDATRSVHFTRFDFAGSATTAQGTIALSALNVWPAHNTAALLTPAFGSPPVPIGVNVIALAPLDAAGTFRLDDRAAALALPPLRIALGAGAAFPVAAADTVTIVYDTTPTFAGVQSAIGGGPLLVRDGAAVDDPASPNYATRGRRIPVAAAALLADGTLALVTVDGHRATTSIGVSRGEFCALLIALGASDAMLFDSGGSATLVARRPGDVAATVVNDPSDGTERPVADGLFAYSDTPIGPAAQLIVTPARIVALPGARVALRSRVIDAAGHFLHDATGPWTIDVPADVASIDAADVLHAGTRRGVVDVPIARGGVHATLPLEIVGRVARIVIGPLGANPPPHGTIALEAQAYDERDRRVAIDGVTQWSAAGAAIDAGGELMVGARDAAVTVAAGGIRSTVTIPVGRHTSSFFLIDPHGAPWTLVTVPARGPGTVNADTRGVTLSYDFSAGGRGAYAIGDRILGAPLVLTCAVDGDGNGEALRATLVDRYGDRETATFTRALAFHDTRRLSIAIPPSLAAPVVLHAIYVVGSLANPPISAAGSVVVHDCTTTVPGT